MLFASHVSSPRLGLAASIGCRVRPRFPPSCSKQLDDTIAFSLVGCAEEVATKMPQKPMTTDNGKHGSAGQDRSVDVQMPRYSYL
jgi:hypothetical protein